MHTILETTPCTGQFMLSEPFLTDANFQRTVIFMTEHHAQGTIGYILNRPMNVLVSDIIPEMVGVNAPLYWGGPVQENTLHCLHRAGDYIESSVEIMSGVWWGGSLEEILDVIRTGQASLDQFKFLVGYSGWSAGQLERELQEKAWLLARATAETTMEQIFDHDTKNLWSRFVKTFGKDYERFTTLPAYPNLN
jgi:putative transcriptional regulator